MRSLQGTFSTPLNKCVGRGRGIPTVLQFSSPVQSGVVRAEGNGRVLAEATSVSGDRVPSQTQCSVPTTSAQATDFATTDPFPPSPDIVGQMSDIIRHVGQQLADSIVAQLSPTHNVATHKNSVLHDMAVDTSARSLDSSQVLLVPHRKVREPPAFKGDDTDTVNVHEWEDLMRNYMRRANVAPEHQAGEILMNLRGRAKDVVKVSTRNGAVDVSQNPDAIYGLLRKHFATVPCSPLPLADFYTTLPENDEGAYDYWLRINNAAEIAADRLREQGRDVDCSSLDVTRMFIKNCPSNDLSMTFRSKTIVVGSRGPGYTG
ncbi:uncharacterized protein LOC127611349 isoform X2 [Hippocampus zosterae]|uniref:uncharacterized protein LOC127611349 isoform X1 n=1 Tax=Hippocampus zosterae TaxID=109293 RepID=UPI00223CC309|nr:uncharacterized protein LOC127611349 isoform X1 [Hippocampus zosterae]XP_051937815.1 uncharacterized protein LOC127611349 isoform X2 [Hippocampus zosterae]